MRLHHNTVASGEARRNWPPVRADDCTEALFMASVASPSLWVCYIDRDAQGGAKGKPKQGQCNRRTGHAVSAADILVYDSPLSVMTKGSYGYRL